MSEFGKCAECPNDAVLKLNKTPLCMRCYDKAMKGIGRSIKYIKEALNHDRP